MKSKFVLWLGVWLLYAAVAGAAENSGAQGTNRIVTRNYILVPNDVVQVFVYQEDDLNARVRLAKDGSVTLPLLGPVQIGGKTREQAALHIQTLLGNKYLVNPQVSLDVVEYAKRRFTVLGHVQRPGTYEIPGDETINLLQAISMAGGYTRLGAGNKVTVQRGEGASKQIFKLDADEMARKKEVEIFEIIADDTITVGEKLF